MRYTHTLLAGLFLPLLMLLAGCRHKTFRIYGQIDRAQDSLLYLEHMSLDGAVVIDSVRLNADGAFSFEQQAQDSITPDFYRLRIAGQIINISIDSTEQVEVRAKYPTMSSNYEVKGSKECVRIRELANMQQILQNQVNAAVSNPEWGVEQVEAAVNQYLTVYKNNVKTRYIFKQPMAASSYFALFQTYILGNRQLLIFNPSASKADVQVYAAVATSWDTYYPGSERGLNLHNIAIEGMKNIRIMEYNQQGGGIDPKKVKVSNMIDISLTDNKGVRRTLSSLAGKVVLLDFHLFAAKDSYKRIMWLRKLYEKYHAQGFEIYQVSYDENEHFWKTQTAALPWISVYRGDDAAGVDADTYLNAAGKQLPAMFLLDKQSNVAKGNHDLDTPQAVENAIKALL